MTAVDLVAAIGAVGTLVTTGIVLIKAGRWSAMADAGFKGVINQLATMESTLKLYVNEEIDRRVRDHCRDCREIREGRAAGGADR